MHTLYTNALFLGFVSASMFLNIQNAMRYAFQPMDAAITHHHNDQQCSR